MLRGLIAGLALALATIPVSAGPADVITAAEYAEPTTRYDHAVLGDNAEWGALVLTLDACPDCAAKDSRSVTIRLPDFRVFEDIAPRLLDLDNDGLPEVVVIESDLAKGSRLAVYDETGAIAATPFIGNSNRWLAPLGAADLDGDGLTELAYVDRPHLAKILRVWRYENQRLTEIAELPGLTNHRIGEPFISGGIRDCGAGPELITADANWRQIMATRLRGGTLSSEPIAPFGGPASFTAALTCR